jgi:outer membrane receptor protein involved in Fe transport
MKNLKRTSQFLLRIIPIFFITIFSANLFAQTQERVRISGEVIDAATGEGVAYATVSLVDTTGVVITAWAADGKGAFDHRVGITGRLTISAGAIGYDRASKEIDIEAPATDAGRLELNAGVEIDGVVVTSSVPLVTAEIDKITYNVTADPETPVNTLLDMMRKVPLLSVDAEDNVLMQGQSNFKVLVNGRNSSMMNNNFKDVAKSMPANSVKNIEVITSPSSRYEAEGIGGIINIITNREQIGGYNGSLSLGGDMYGTVNADAYLNAKAGKFSVSGHLGGLLQRSPGGRSTRNQENYESDIFRYENTESRSGYQKFNGIFYSVQASYEIDSLNLLSMDITGDYIDMKTPNHYSSLYTDIDGKPVRNYTSDYSSNSGIGYISGTIDYQRLFRKPDRMLTASYMVSANNNDRTSLSRINGIVDYRSYLQRSVDDSRFREHTLQIDYVDPLATKHSIETGLKFILRENGSDPQTYERPDESTNWVLDTERRNALDYYQYIMHVYGAYTFKLNKFSAKAGVRMETVWNDGTFRNATTDSPFDNTQLNVIPNITLSYAPKPSSRYSLSYTQRLYRPGIWYLNPYVNNTNPMNISYGNPELDAEIGHMINASWGLFGSKHSLNLSGYASFMNNAIEYISTADADGVTTSTYYNIGSNARYGMSAYYSGRPSGKVSLSVNAGGSYADLKGGNDFSNSGFSGFGSLNTRISLWKGGAATANAYYSTSSISLQSTGKTSMYFYGFGLSQQAFNQKVTFTLSTSMPFEKNRYYSSVTEDRSFYRLTESWYPARSLRFSVRWNFGKTQVQVKRARRGIRNDDIKAGGDSSSGTTTQQ